jgi:hypothetical protein
MNILKKLFGQDPRNATASGPHSDPPQAGEQAVLVHLDASGLPAETYENYDLSTLEDQLIEAIDRTQSGEYDGHEFGPGETVLYLYGPSAEALFSAIEASLRSYPLSHNARVVIRSGPPGSPEREVLLGA